MTLLDIIWLALVLGVLLAGVCSLRPWQRIGFRTVRSRVVLPARTTGSQLRSRRTIRMTRQARRGLGSAPARTPRAGPTTGPHLR